MIKNYEDNTFYVAMTYSHARWGKPEDEINRCVVECDNWQPAEQIWKVAQKDPELKDITMYTKKPNYHPALYDVLEMHYNGLGTDWTEGKYRTA